MTAAPTYPVGWTPTDPCPTAANPVATVNFSTMPLGPVEATITDGTETGLQVYTVNPDGSQVPAFWLDEDSNSTPGLAPAPWVITGGGSGGGGVSGSIQQEGLFAVAKDAAGDLQGWVFNVFEDDTGEAGSGVALRSLGFRAVDGTYTADWAVPAGWTLEDSAATPVTAAPVQLVRHQVRLDASSANAVAVPGNALVDPIPGRSFTVPAGFRAVSWNFNREQPQADTPAEGRLDVDGFGYVPGSGPQYQELGTAVGSDSGESFRDEMVFVTSGANVFVEILYITEA